MADSLDTPHPCHLPSQTETLRPSEPQEVRVADSLRSRRARYVSQGAVMTPAWRFLLARLLVARVVVVEHGDDHDEGAARYG